MSVQRITIGLKGHGLACSSKSIVVGMLKPETTAYDGEACNLDEFESATRIDFKDKASAVLMLNALHGIIETLESNERAVEIAKGERISAEAWDEARAESFINYCNTGNHYNLFKISKRASEIYDRKASESK